MAESSPWNSTYGSQSFVDICSSPYSGERATSDFSNTMECKHKKPTPSQAQHAKSKKKVRWHRYLVYKSMTNVSHRNAHEQEEGQGGRVPIAPHQLPLYHKEDVKQVVKGWRAREVQFTRRAIERPCDRSITSLPSTVTVSWNPWTSWAPWILSEMMPELHSDTKKVVDSEANTGHTELEQSSNSVHGKHR